MKSNSMNKKSVGLGVIALMYLMAVLYSVDFQLSNIWFLTPGIWGMQGESFWVAFFAELPFVLLRVLPIVLLIGIVVINIMISVRQYLHREER